MKKSQMEVDFDKWLSGYAGTCSDNHALYQAFCAGYEAAQQSVQADLPLGVPHGQSCACDECRNKFDTTFKPASR